MSSSNPPEQPPSQDNSEKQPDTAQQASSSQTAAEGKGDTEMEPQEPEIPEDILNAGVDEWVLLWMRFRISETDA